MAQLERNLPDWRKDGHSGVHLEAILKVHGPA